MGGIGRAPKDPGQRRRYNQPARGEWIELEPPEGPVLEPFDPETMTVSKRLWDAWRICGPATQYDEEDRASIRELAVRYEELPWPSRLSWMDKLGLTPRGKRDLRWRTPNEVRTIKRQAEKAPVRHIRAVGSDKETS